MINELHIGKDDVVACTLPNQFATPIIILAIWAVGAVFTGFDHRLRFKKLKYHLEQTQPDVIFCCEENEERIVTLVTDYAYRKEPVKVVRLDDISDLIQGCYFDNSFEEFCKLPVESFANEMAAVIFTAGSTGLPKPVVKLNCDLIHASIILDSDNLLSPLSDKGCFGLSIPFYQITYIQTFLHCLACQIKIAIVKQTDSVAKLFKDIDQFKVSRHILYLLSNQN